MCEMEINKIVVCRHIARNDARWWCRSWFWPLRPFRVFHPLFLFFFVSVTNVCNWTTVDSSCCAKESWRQRVKIKKKKLKIKSMGIEIKVCFLFFYFISKRKFRRVFFTEIPFSIRRLKFYKKKTWRYISHQTRPSLFCPIWTHMFRPHSQISCSKGVRVLFGCANLFGTSTLSHGELRDMVNIGDLPNVLLLSTIYNKKLKILNCPDWDWHGKCRITDNSLAKTKSHILISLDCAAVYSHILPSW
jgi:hypothetical protein